MPTFENPCGAYSRYEITKAVPLERLEKICTAERDGRLWVLPCEVGTNVAVVDSSENTVEICRVTGYEQYGSGKLEISVQNAPKHQEWYTLDCFGKTVFLTREEAETALKEV